jgi:hypothetical protein
VPVLEAYCVAVEMARVLSETLKTVGPGDERFADLVKLQRAEAALVARLAGTLRLTPRSTWSRTPQLVSAKKPWELGRAGPVVSDVAHPFAGWDVRATTDTQNGPQGRGDDEPPPGVA